MQSAPKSGHAIHSLRIMETHRPTKLRTLASKRKIYESKSGFGRDGDGSYITLHFCKNVIQNISYCSFLPSENINASQSYILSVAILSPGNEDCLSVSQKRHNSRSAVRILLMFYTIGENDIIRNLLGFEKNLVFEKRGKLTFEGIRGFLVLSQNCSKDFSNCRYQAELTTNDHLVKTACV